MKAAEQGERRLRSLEDACEINPPKLKPSSKGGETEILFVPMSAIDENSGAVTAAEKRHIDDVRGKSYTSFAPGDVLFAKITPCMENGKSAIVPPIPSGIGFGSTEFHVLRPRANVSSRFIWHFVRQKRIRRDAQERMTGSVGHARVPADYMRQIPFPDVQFEQQERIADRLDRVRAAEHNVEVRLQAARSKIDRLGRAILASACSGFLTAEWRDSHASEESASSLVDDIASSRHGITSSKARIKVRVETDDQEELPDTWIWTPLGSLVDVATGATPLRKRSDYYGGTIPWVTSGAVNAGLITTPTECITELAVEETNAKVFPAGTLLVAMYGEGQTRGRVAELGIDAATNQAVAALLFSDSSDNLREYLKIFLLENYERIRSMSYGGVQPNLNLSSIRNTLVPLPPRVEQGVIAERVKVALRLKQQLTDRLDVAMRMLDRASESFVTNALMNA